MVIVCFRSITARTKATSHLKQARSARFPLEQNFFSLLPPPQVQTSMSTSSCRHTPSRITKPLVFAKPSCVICTYPTTLSQCKANIFGTTAGARVNVDQLSFLEDGASLHLIMNGSSAMTDAHAGGQASGVFALCLANILVKTWP